jgi:2-(1,2-epoxy-1,2-dihydrophenyl)acetyl-CoA isomerase
VSEAAESSDVLLRSEGGVATITLNRPEALNAWTGNLGIELVEALRRARDDESTRAIAITGAGRAFSSGADLSQPPELTDDGKADLRARLVEIYNPVILEIREIPKPVVAVVNGPAVGIGCSLALACDLIIAGESAYFLLAFANIGLTLDGGASAFLAARLGHARSTELALLAERLAAPAALEWGLVNRVFADEQLAEEANALMARLAAGATRSYAASKRLLSERLYPGLAEQLELEADLQQEMAESEDFPEGVVAFLQRRDAQFKGR